MTEPTKGRGGRSVERAARQERAERVAVLRATFRHENDLVNHRLSWLGVFTGFALAAVESDPFAQLVTRHPYAKFEIALVSIVITLSGQLALSAGAVAMQLQAREFRRLMPGVESDQPGRGILGVELPLRWGMPSTIIPTCANAIWITIALRGGWDPRAHSDQAPAWCGLLAAIVIQACWFRWQRAWWFKKRLAHRRSKQ